MAKENTSYGRGTGRKVSAKAQKAYGKARAQGATHRQAYQKASVAAGGGREGV